MDPIVKNKLDKMYDLALQKVNKIVEIFNDFYGEEKVDLQNIISIDTFIKAITSIRIKDIIDGPQLSNECTKVFDRYKDMLLSDLDASDAELLITELSNSINISRLQISLNSTYNIPFILVHFPYILITNEYNQSTEIKHLYVKIKLKYTGTMYSRFEFNRAEYSYSHFINDYMHSHISHIPKGDFESFIEPCLGSGPIKNTCYNLRNFSLDDDTFEDMWRMFCLELSKYVEVESLAGVPYHKLHELGITGHLINENNTFTYNILPFNRKYPFNTQYKNMKNFIKDFIPERKLRFNYINGSYSIGMTYFEYVMTISNSFIEWYNKQYNNKKYPFSLQQLISDNIIRNCVIYNNKFYTERENDTTHDVSLYNGRKVCTFKGKDIYVIVHEKEAQENLPSYFILTPVYTLGILTNILYIINYEYSKPTFIPEEGVEPCKKIRIF